VPADVLGVRARAEQIVDAASVLHAVDQVAVRIALRLQDANPWVLTVMHGALPFAGWLLPRLAFPLEVGYLHVSRYRNDTAGGDLRWHSQPEYPLQGRTVLLVDDVLDRGETLAALVDWMREAGAAEVLTAVLVDKVVNAPRPAAADFAALQGPDRFLFGCGMDYRGYWRNLPAVYALADGYASAEDRAGR
jgi:hypoxanthine phosphoribosyltransferase